MQNTPFHSYYIAPVSVIFERKLDKNSFTDATAKANAHYICQDKDIELKLV